MENGRIIILGHSGFIGTHLEKYLSEVRSEKIIGCSLPDVDLTNSDSLDGLKKYFDNNTTVILTAAVKRQFSDNIVAFKNNLRIIENICQLIEKFPIRRLIYFSSAAVYGEETENTNIDELTLVNPTSYYGIAKYCSERLLRKSCVNNKVTSLVCLRPPLIYGSGDKGKTYGPSGFIDAAQSGNEIILWGDGSELREFIYINDVCRIIDELLDSIFDGDINVVSGNSFTFKDVISVLRKQYEELVVSTKPRSKVKVDNAFNPEKIKALLPNDFNFTSLKNGIENILKQY